MSELKLCRICLRTQCKVYSYNKYQLKHFYEEVMAMRVKDNDGLPQYFCYECATMLHKFHKFKEKCYMGQKILKECTWIQPISYETIYSIDRAQHNLLSPLQILNVSKRVRTYVLKDNAEDVQSESDSVGADKIDVEEPTEVYLSEDVMASDDLFDEAGDDIKDDIDIDEKPLEVKAITSTSPPEIEPITSTSPPEIEPVDVKTEAEDTVTFSPKTVYVDDKKDIVVLEDGPLIKKSKESHKTRKKVKRKRKCIDMNNWKKYVLTEEAAVKEFRLKAKGPKYQNAKFKCEDCYKGFSEEIMLKRHVQLCHSESLGSLECHFCHMRFKMQCYLNKHMRQHYTRYKCLICGLECCLDSTVQLHEDYHKGIVRKCELCGEEFKHASTYYTHMRTHRSDYICTTCGMSFVSPSGLKMHHNKKHVVDEIDSPDDDEEVNTYCEKCNIHFETRKAYEEHLFHSALHVEYTEALDPVHETLVLKKILGKKLKAKITNCLKRKVPLDEKVKILSDGKGRKRRRYKKPTSCHQCGKHFDTQAACLKHHLAEHPRTSFFAPNERHICEICGASLAPGSVAMHENIHSKKKTFPCDTCGKTFHTTMGLSRHKVTHTGEKPFKCSHCDKRFTQSNSMKLHYRTFHLKQPYPKRNRRKKKEEAQDSIYNNKSPEESEASLTEAAADNEVGETEQSHGDNNMHYLTLS